MATTHRTKQVNLRFPLPLLSQIKTKADAQQQAIADWILAAVSREFEPAETSEQTKNSPEVETFVLHPELLEYIQNCLAPLQSEITELRTALGESAA
jgi:cell division septum initiation protein DivIVA